MTTEPEYASEHATEPEPEQIEPTRFTRPGPPRPEVTQAREDDPPSNVPRDQYDRPLIVLPDGSDVRAYVRASKYGKIIEDYYTLHRWDERNIVWGLSRAHHLIVRAQSVPEQIGKVNYDTLQDIAERAKIIAQADAGAVTGTGLHLLSVRRDAGEDLSYLDPHTAMCVDAYGALMAPFEVLATETFVINDLLGAAGSFDRVIRLRFPLRWPDGVVWPAGMIVVVDVKTGKITSMPYWGSDFTCQQLVYATGEPYDPGVTVLQDPNKRSAANVLAVRDQPGLNGRIGWAAIGVPSPPTGAMIAHIPARDPSQAHWERVNLDTAREDADAARRAWARNRVDRSARFLALPAEALVPPDGITLDVPSGQYPEPVDTSPSTSSESIMAAKRELADRQRAQTTDALRLRIARADSTDKIDALYDSWGTSPAWSDELTEACQAAYDRLTPPTDVIDCDGCNYDRHLCPACGVHVPHGVDACPACALRVELDGAPTLDTLEALWLAHGPAGDGLWTQEHSDAAQAAYNRLSPDTMAQAESAPFERIEPGEGDPPEDDPAEQRPETDTGPPAYDASLPVDPDAEPDDADAALSAAATRINAAHDDKPYGAPAADVFQGPDDDPAGPPEPGPFDDTRLLAELRTLIDEAPDEAALIALYDAHKAQAEGGTGLWDDECSDRAQRVYDRLSPPGSDPVDTPAAVSP